jgi:hypothetical protein
MKKTFFVVILITIAIGTFAVIRPMSPEKNSSWVSAKTIDITVTVNGYTIHIVGTVDYSVWSGKTTINATITVTGNGANISLPFNYSGPLNSSKLDTALYSFPTDQEVADFVVSCIDFNTMTIVYPDGGGGSVN